MKCFTDTVVEETPNSQCSVAQEWPGDPGLPIYGGKCEHGGAERENGPSGTIEKQKEKLQPQASQPSLNKCDFCVSSGL